MSCGNFRRESFEVGTTNPILLQKSTATDCCKANIRSDFQALSLDTAAIIAVQNNVALSLAAVNVDLATTSTLVSSLVVGSEAAEIVPIIASLVSGLATLRRYSDDNSALQAANTKKAMDLTLLISDLQRCGVGQQSTIYGFNTNIPLVERGFNCHLFDVDPSLSSSVNVS